MTLRILFLAASTALLAVACGDQLAPPATPLDPTTTPSESDTSQPTGGADTVQVTPDTAEPTQPGPTAEARAMQTLARSVLVYWAAADLDGLFALGATGGADHRDELAPGTQYHDYLFGPGSWQMEAVTAWNRGELGEVRGDQGRRAVRFHTFADGTVAAVDLSWDGGRWVFENLVRVTADELAATWGPLL
ncbi:MAG: hypothetical protein KC635_20590 [Myxococcales bacterium]|nr:hypothetical protein [Myxococcales bacterium]